MPSKSAKGKVATERAQKRASSSCQAHCKESGKETVAAFIESNPDKLAFIEKFIGSELWQKPQSQEALVARFCRGRTIIGKIPPSWTAQQWAKVCGVPAAGFMLLQKRSQDFLARSYAFTGNLRFDANIAECMDGAC